MDTETLESANMDELWKKRLQSTVFSTGNSFKHLCGLLVALAFLGLAISQLGTQGTG